MLRTYSRLTEKEMILGPVILAPKDNNKLINTVYETLKNPKKYSENKNIGQVI